MINGFFLFGKLIDKSHNYLVVAFLFSGKKFEVVRVIAIAGGMFRRVALLKTVVKPVKCDSLGIHKN